MIGKELGHYRILEKIGEGGMGAVFKARDTHLDRFVAIKVLPEEKASDVERRRRFVQEAKAASALNHPNIITVHDAANTDGLYYIVMEYVGGKTLDELIRRRPMRPNEALGYAIQIADALGRAHAEGIVHRDLKPSNIMVDPHGQVKVLDFGLAKLVERDSSPESATATLEPGTGVGVVVGTVAYMSPEQAEGEAVDSRTDVFSFGLVLYEMLTGLNPFRRDSRVSTMSAILNEEPKPISEQTSALPPELDRAVMRCLRKDPGRRWQNMSDLKSLLEDVREDSESGKSSAGEIRRSRRSQWPIWAGAGGVILIAAVALTVWLLRSLSSGREYATARVTFDSGLTWQPTISRDGRLIAYSSDRSGEGKPDIWVRHLDQSDPIRRTNDPVGATQPSLSPDGSRIVFCSTRDGGIICAIDTLGGEERKLVDDGVFPRFSPDGTRIVFTRLAATGLPAHNKMYIMPARGGEVRPFLPDYGVVIGRSGLGPIWSPDGRHLLFKGQKGEESTTHWLVAPAEGGGATRVDIDRAFTNVPFQPLPSVWLTGDSVIATVGATIEGFNLHRLRLSREGFQVTGGPEQLTSGPGLKYDVSASADGTVLFDNINWSTFVAGIPVPTSTHRTAGEPQPITSDSSTKLDASASRDGRMLVWTSLSGYAAGPRVEMRVRHVVSGRESVIGDSSFFLFKHPRLSSDGSLVAYIERAQGGLIAMVAPTSGGTPQRLGSNVRVEDFFPGNKEVLILQGSRRLARQALSGGDPLPLAEATSGGIVDPRLSADGQLAVFTLARNDGSAALCIVPVRDRIVPESDWVIALESRRRWLGEPNWAPNGAAVYYACEDAGLNSIMGLAVDPGTGRPAGEPFTVLARGSSKRSLAGVRTPSGFCVTRDRLYFIMAEVTGNLWMLKRPE